MNKYKSIALILVFLVLSSGCSDKPAKDRSQEFASYVASCKEKRQPIRVAKDFATVLVGVNLSDYDFSNVDFTDVTIVACNITRGKFNDAVFRNARVLNTVMNECNFKDSTIENAYFSGTQMNAVNITGGTILGSVFSNCNLANSEITGISVDQTIFDSINAKSLQLSRSKVTNSKIYSSDLSSAKMFYSEFRGTEIHGAKASLSSWNYAYWSNVSAKVSDFTSANFVETVIEKSTLDRNLCNKARFARGKLVDSLVRDSYFVQASILGLQVQNSRFEDSNFTDATLDDNLTNILGTNTRIDSPYSSVKNKSQVGE